MEIGHLLKKYVIASEQATVETKDAKRNEKHRYCKVFAWGEEEKKSFRKFPFILNGNENYFNRQGHFWWLLILISQSVLDWGKRETGEIDKPCGKHGFHIIYRHLKFRHLTNQNQGR